MSTYLESLGRSEWPTVCRTIWSSCHILPLVAPIFYYGAGKVHHLTAILESSLGATVGAIADRSRSRLNWPQVSINTPIFQSKNWSFLANRSIADRVSCTVIGVEI